MDAGQQRVPVPPGRRRVGSHEPYARATQSTGTNKGENHRDKEVRAVNAWHVILKYMRNKKGDVGTKNHEFAVGHIDDAHLPKNNG